MSRPSLMMSPRLPSSETARRANASAELFGYAIRDELLFGIAAHIGEGQYRHRRLIGQCELGLGRTHRLARNLAQPDVIHPQRARYIFDALLASILEGKIELVAHLGIRSSVLPKRKAIMSPL